MMRVLVAPQEFKGSLTASEVAAAIATGMGKVAPDWQYDLLPLSDGGPGFLDALRVCSPKSCRIQSAGACQAGSR